MYNTKAYTNVSDEEREGTDNIDVKSNEDISEKDKNEEDRIVKITATIILGILVWIPLWIVFFIVNIVDHVFYCIGELTISVLSNAIFIMILNDSYCS
jgi:hypothetical protein